MGFGSYDESEQRNDDVNTDDSDAINVHAENHDGEVSVEGDLSTDDLVGKLQEMKDDPDDDDPDEDA